MGSSSVVNEGTVLHGPCSLPSLDLDCPSGCPCGSDAGSDLGEGTPFHLVQMNTHRLVVWFVVLDNDLVLGAGVDWGFVVCWQDRSLAACWGTGWDMDCRPCFAEVFQAPDSTLTDPFPSVVDSSCGEESSADRLSWDIQGIQMVNSACVQEDCCTAAVVVDARGTSYQLGFPLVQS